MADSQRSPEAELVDSSGYPQRRETPGCAICRARKVKCDRQANGCIRCHKLGVTCPGYEAGKAKDARELDEFVDQIYQDAGRTRRAKGACGPCQRAKVRCNESRPCARCTRRGTICTSKPSRSSKQLDDGEARSITDGDRDQSSPAPSNVATSQVAASNQQASTLSPTKPEAWLYAEDLPQSSSLLNLLVTKFFDRARPMLDFIHPHSFKHAVEQRHVTETYSLALLNIICAIGAIHYQEESLGAKPTSLPGISWAQKAESLAFQNLGRVTTLNLMALVLLWEYHSHYGSQTTCLMIAASCSRSAQILRLDVDSDDNQAISDSLERITHGESRRRLFWACWMIDITVSAGVDRLMTISRRVPRAPLPRREEDFIYQIASPTADLSTASNSDLDPGAINQWSQLSLEAWYVRVNHLRSLTLQCVRDGYASPLPWESGSPFQQISQQLETWSREIPAHLRLTEQNAYVHLDKRRLGAFIGLHVIYHICHCDLFRIVMPGYGNFPIRRVLHGAPHDFMTHYQNECRHHAEMITNVFRIALQHRFFAGAFDDTFCGIGAYESSRIQLLATRIAAPSTPESSHASPATQHSAQSPQTILQNLEINLTVLELSTYSNDRQRKYVRALAALMQESPLKSTLADGLFTQESEHDAQGRHSLSPLMVTSHPADQGPAPDNPVNRDHLHPMAMFRLAWEELAAIDVTSPSYPSGGMNVGSGDSLGTSRTTQSHINNAVSPRSHTVRQSSFDRAGGQQSYQGHGTGSNFWRTEDFPSGADLSYDLFTWDDRCTENWSPDAPIPF